MNETLHTPTSHSNTVGGSSAGRVIACPASMKLVRTVPSKPSSSYADEGTALHNCVEHCLYEGLSAEEAQELVGKEFYGIPMTQEHIDTCIVPSLNAFDAYYDKLVEEDGDVLSYALEVQVHFPGIPDAFGTVDVLMVTPKRAVVWDWKFGAGVPVSSKHNKQLAFYARAAAHSAPQFFWPDGDVDPANPDAPDWDVDFVIFQPRINEEPDVWSTTYSVLCEFEGTLLEAVEEAMGDDPTYKRGDHCRWCAASAICPLYKDVATKLVAAGMKLPEGDEPMADELEEQGVDLPVPPHTPFTPEELADWLKMADIVETWAKAVRGLAMDEAKSGRPPAKMKLVQKLGNTAYTETDINKIDGVLARRGLSVEERRKPWTPITPTQATKLLKKLGKELPKGYTERPKSGVALVPLSDKRPAIRTVDEKGKEIAAKLSQE